MDKTSGKLMCIGGYQRCLILYRDCLTVATMLQEMGLFEKAEIHRNDCEERLVPLCMSGLAVCQGLKGETVDEVSMS